MFAGFEMLNSRLQGGLSSLGGSESEALSLEEVSSNAPRVARLMESRRPPAEELVYEHTGPAFYHAMTYGLVLDQLVRRVDPMHRSLAKFFIDEVAAPLRLDVHPSIPKHLFHRCVTRLLQEPHRSFNSLYCSVV